MVDTTRDPRNWAVNYRWAPTSNVANEFIFGYNNYNFFFATDKFDIPYAFNLVTTPGTNAYGNGRGVSAWQFIDNLTWVKSNHTLKGGVNFRLGLQTDSRSSVAGSVIEGNINFSADVNNNFNAFGLPTFSATSINNNDLTRLRSQINDYLGRVGTYNQAFVANPDGLTFAPAGTRWIFEANYGEYDFYFQDTWRVRQNLVLDLGVRWEPKLSPTSASLPILTPDKPFTLGSAPSNTLRWVEGPLFQNDWNNLHLQLDLPGIRLATEKILFAQIIECHMIGRKLIFLGRTFTKTPLEITQYILLIMLLVLMVGCLEIFRFLFPTLLRLSYDSRQQLELPLKR